MSPAKRNIFIVTYTENSPQQNSLPERRRNQNRQTETGALQNVCNLSENPCTHQMEWNGIRLSLSCLFFCSMCLLFGTIYKSAPQFSGISQNTPPTLSSRSLYKLPQLRLHQHTWPRKRSIRQVFFSL